jgi:hypothetical protein
MKNLKQFGDLQEQLDDPIFFLRMGKYVARIFSVQNDFPSEGRKFVFGLWNCDIFDGFVVTDEEFTELQLHGKVYCESAGWDIRIISEDEALGRWDDVEKVPRNPFWMTFVKFNGDQPTQTSTLFSHLIANDPDAPPGDEMIQACRIYLSHNKLWVAFPQYIKGQKSESRTPYARVRESIISASN